MSDIMTRLTARGVRLWAAGDHIEIEGDLSPAEVAELRAHKTAVLDALRTACRDCGGPRDQQSADSWFCPHCRRWSSADGDPIPAHSRPAVRRLIDELRAAGVGFVADDDELRLRHPPTIPAHLLSAVEQYRGDPEFVRLVIAAAEAEFSDASPFIN